MKKILSIIVLSMCSFVVFAENVDKNRLLSLLRQTEFFIMADNYERAAELCNQATAMFKILGADNDQNTISGLHTISHAYSEKKMFRDAIKTESLLVEVFPLAMPDNISDYALYLNDLSLYLMGGQEMALAEDKIKKALSLVNEKDVIKNLELVTIYLRAAEIYQATTPKRLDLSIKYQKIVVDIYAKEKGKTSSEYLSELSYLGKYYEETEDYENACNVYLEIMHTRADNNIKDEKELLNFLPILDRIIFCSRKINNREREEQCKEIAFKIAAQGQPFHKAKYQIAEFPSINDSLYYITISNKMNEFTERIRLIEDDSNGHLKKQIQEELKQYLAEQPDSYGKVYLLSYETIIKSLMSDWKSTIQYGLESLRIFDNLGIITEQYVNSLVCIAEAYDKLDIPAKAYDYILKAYELRDDYLSSNHMYYIGILNDLALYSSRLGNYEDAIKYGMMAVEAKESLIYTDEAYGYFLSLNNLATYYSNAGHNEKYLEVMQQLAKRAEEIYPSVLDYPENPFMYNLSNGYYKNGYYEKAIEIGLKVKDIREKGAPKYLISNIYELLAKAYRRKGDIEKSLNYAILANNIQKEIGEDDNLSLSNTYDLLAAIYNDMGKLKQAEEMERYAVNLDYNNIIHNFLDLPSDDRYSYWSMYSNIFNIWYPNYFYRAKVSDATELYNKSALFAKGILLNSDTELSRLIIESGDNNAISKFQQLLFNNSLLSKINSDEEQGLHISRDSLRTETTKLERELIKDCKVFGDYTRSMRITWKDVQASLKPNDIAIEFLSFPLIDKNGSFLDKTLYIALILNKKEKPHYIELFEEKELDLIKTNNIDNRSLYNLIWGKLGRYLKGIDNIYFSPSGKLYNINLEDLPEIVGISKNEKYYRVSSTRVLVSSNSSITSGKEDAIIYGGLKYDITVDGLIADSKLYESKKNSFRGNVEKLGLRHGWDYLPETLVEVNSIGAIMKKEEIPAKVYTDSLGTEASFKSHDGHSSKILHIATHGFYYAENDIANLKDAHLDYMIDQVTPNSRSYKEDYSLSRSGLLMAGCNNILRGEKLPNDIDDGILFAKEIAGMNLKNLDLVTMSSCDSGLGDVTGEGVYGLQRAFKKAGARTILMSLQKVDDEATQILMVEFYKNLVSGKSKHQSLKDAQKNLRQVDNGKYDKPEYWASFIMLDGIN